MPFIEIYDTNSQRKRSPSYESLFISPSWPNTLHISISFNLLKSQNNAIGLQHWFWLQHSTHVARPECLQLFRPKKHQYIDKHFRMCDKITIEYYAYAPGGVHMLTQTKLAQLHENGNPFFYKYPVLIESDWEVYIGLVVWMKGRCWFR